MDIPHEIILVIDDDYSIRQSYVDWLEDLEYIVSSAENGRLGIEILKNKKVDLVLVDLQMPEIDGLGVLAWMNDHTPQIPSIVISGTGVIKNAVEALRCGAWDYLLKPIEDFDVLTHAVKNSLEKAQLRLENSRYQEHLEELVVERTNELNLRNQQLEVSRRQIIGILSHAAEYRDFETGNHFMRVSEYTGIIAKGLGMSREYIHTIQLAAPVHDIGKIGIPDSILLKKGKLQKSEWKTMKSHCQYGESILTSQKFILPLDQLNTGAKPEDDCGVECTIIAFAADIALNHHEHWDGSGYPIGLKGKQIPLKARITAVADVYDALGSIRPYKAAWPEDQCQDYIREQAGHHFDPEIVTVFFDNIEHILDIKNKLNDGI